MSIKRTVRKTHQSGAWVYATLEALAGGYATVRLARNGARVSNLPVATPGLRIGDQVILDYSAGIPPAVIPAVAYEQIVARKLEVTKVQKEEAETILPALTSDIGVKLKRCSNVGAGTIWETINWLDVVWDTAVFFDPLIPTQITFLVAGLYLLIARIEITYPGVLSTLSYQMRFYSPESSFALPIAGDFPLVGVDENNIHYYQQFPFLGTGTNKQINVKGLGAFKAGETMQLQVRAINGTCSFVDNDISPSMEVQILGQIQEVL